MQHGQHLRCLSNVKFINLQYKIKKRKREKPDNGYDWKNAGCGFSYGCFWDHFKDGTITEPGHITHIKPTASCHVGPGHFVCLCSSRINFNLHLNAVACRLSQGVYRGAEGGPRGAAFDLTLLRLKSRGAQYFMPST